MQPKDTTAPEIKRVLIRKNDKLKYVIIPRKSSIVAGDWVSIKKVSEAENGK